MTAVSTVPTLTLISAGFLISRIWWLIWVLDSWFIRLSVYWLFIFILRWLLGFDCSLFIDVVLLLGRSIIIWGLFPNAIRGECVNLCQQVVKVISDRLLVIQIRLCISDVCYGDCYDDSWWVRLLMSAYRLHYCWCCDVHYCWCWCCDVVDFLMFYWIILTLIMSTLLSTYLSMDTLITAARWSRCNSCNCSQMV